MSIYICSEESAKTDKKKQSKWNDYVENTKQ